MLCYAMLCYVMLYYVILHYTTLTSEWLVAVTRGRPDRDRRRGQKMIQSEKGEVLLRGVGTLRDLFPPNASVQWQPDGLTIHTKKWFLGAGFLGAPPISLLVARDLPFQTVSIRILYDI